MSDTPETDKAERMAFASEYMVPTDFARKLERERNEARAALDEIEKYGTEEINAAIKLRQKLAAARIERDEAREALDNKTSARELAAKFGIDPLTEGEHRKNLFVAGLHHGRAEDFLQRKEGTK